MKKKKTFKDRIYPVSKFIIMLILTIGWIFIIRGVNSKIILFGSLLLLIGISLNAIALATNKLKMPVENKDNRWLTDDSIHKTFKSKKNVKFYYLTDIIDIGVGKASIGDILIAVGFIINIGYSLITIFL